MFGTDCGCKAQSGVYNDACPPPPGQAPSGSKSGPNSGPSSADGGDGGKKGGGLGGGALAGIVIVGLLVLGGGVAYSKGSSAAGGGLSISADSTGSAKYQPVGGGETADVSDDDDSDVE